MANLIKDQDLHFDELKQLERMGIRMYYGFLTILRQYNDAIDECYNEEDKTMLTLTAHEVMHTIDELEKDIELIQKKLEQQKYQLN